MMEMPYLALEEGDTKSGGRKGLVPDKEKEVSQVEKLSQASAHSPHGFTLALKSVPCILFEQKQTQRI